jgi:dUTP pyrophosphatase
MIDGTIDEGYTGEIGVTMRSMAQGTCHFAKGERICQLVVMPFCPVEIVQAELSETERGRDGFGSTGTL